MILVARGRSSSRHCFDPGSSSRDLSGDFLIMAQSSSCDAGTNTTTGSETVAETSDKWVRRLAPYWDSFLMDSSFCSKKLLKVSPLTSLGLVDREDLCQQKYVSLFDRHLLHCLHRHSLSANNITLSFLSVIS